MPWPGTGRPKRQATPSGTMTAAADWQAAQLVNGTATRQLSAALSEFDAEIEAGL